MLVCWGMVGHCTGMLVYWGMGMLVCCGMGMLVCWDMGRSG